MNLLEAVKSGNLALVKELVQKSIKEGAEIGVADKDGLTPLLLAAAFGQNDIINYLLEPQPNNIKFSKLSERNKLGRTALLVAACFGKNHTIDLLIEKYKVSLLEQDEEWESSLSLATQQDHVATVQHLLHLGAFIDLPLKNGRTLVQEGENYKNKTALPLLKAASELLEIAQNNFQKPTDELLKVLQEKGAVNARSITDGNTALHWAVLHNNRPMIRALIKAGARSLPNNKGQTPLDLAKESNQPELSTFCEAALPGEPLLEAVKSGDLKIVQELVQKRISENTHIVAYTDESGSTALLWAAASGHNDIINYLLELQPNSFKFSKLSERNNIGRTALLLAALNGNNNTLDLLLEKNPGSLAEQENNGDSALSLAGKKGHVATVQHLLQLGAFIDLPLKNGPTLVQEVEFYNKDNTTTLPLLKAAAELLELAQKNLQEQKRTDELLKVLQEKGALNARSIKDGNTALHWAVLHNNRPMIRALIKAGARPLPNKAGKTPLDLAKESNQPELSTFYEAVLPGEQFLAAVKSGDLKLVQELVQKRISENANTVVYIDENGDTALLWAAFRGDNDIINYLLNHGGSNLSERNNEGCTALLEAALNGKNHTLDLLLEKNPGSLAEQENNGDSALSFAGKKGHVATVQHLLQLGAFIDLPLKNSRTLVQEVEIYNKTALPLLKAASELLEIAQNNLQEQKRTDELLKTLQEKGALNARSITDGNTALHWAVLHNNRPMIRALRKAGACSLPNKAGKTPFDLAKESNQPELSTFYESVALGEQFLEAVKSGDLKVVQELVQKRISENTHIVAYTDEGEMTALLLAAAKGHNDIINYLLELQPNSFKFSKLSERNNIGRTALLLAALNGNNNTLDLLLEKNPGSLAEQENNGDSALSLAGKKGHVATVQHLLQLGAFIDLPLKNGPTLVQEVEFYNKDNTTTLPLLKAAAELLELAQKNLQEQKRTDELLKVLQEKGALNARSITDGNTALHWAVLHNNRPMIRALRKAGARSLPNNKGKTPLDLAKESNQPELSTFYEAVVAPGGEQFLEAVKSGDLKVVQELVQKRISENINIVAYTDESGSTALLWAAASGHNDIINYLLKDGGSNLSERNNEGLSALLLAALNGKNHTLDLLLEKNPGSLAEQDNDGWSALSFAGRRGHVAAVQHLLRLGAFIDLPLKHQTLMQGVEHYNSTTLPLLKAASELLEIAQKPVGKLRVFAKHLGITQMPKSIDKLLSVLQDGVNARSIKEGNTALHWAVLNKNLMLVQALIDAGARFLPNNEGKTPLDLATESNEPELFNLFPTDTESKQLHETNMTPSAPPPPLPVPITPSAPPLSVPVQPDNLGVSVTTGVNTQNPEASALNTTTSLASPPRILAPPPRPPRPLQLPRLPRLVSVQTQTDNQGRTPILPQFEGSRSASVTTSAASHLDYEPGSIDIKILQENEMLKERVRVLQERVFALETLVKENRVEKNSTFTSLPRHLSTVITPQEGAPEGSEEGSPSSPPEDPKVQKLSSVSSSR